MTRLSKRTSLVGLAIVIFWLIMMYSLFKEKVLVERFEAEGELVKPGELLRDWEDYEEYMGIYSEERLIGLFNAGVKRDERRRGYGAYFRLVVFVGRVADLPRLKWEGMAELDSEFILEKFYLVGDIGSSELWITGAADGERILYKMSRDSKSAYGAIKLEEEPSFMDAAGDLLLRKVDIKSGQIFRMRAFDPVWRFSGGEVEIKIGEKELIRIENTELAAYRIEMRLNRTRTTSWVTESGQIVKRELIKGITMSKINKVKAEALALGFGEAMSMVEIDMEDLRRNAKTVKRVGGIMETLRGIILEK